MGELQKRLLCRVKPKEGKYIYAWIMDVHLKVKAKTMPHIFAQPHPSCFTQHTDRGANIKKTFTMLGKDNKCSGMKISAWYYIKVQAK